MGDSGVQSVWGEIRDNWPAFVYITLMILFSICFFRERRAEARAIRQMLVGLQEGIDKLERAMQGRFPV